MTPRYAAILALLAVSTAAAGCKPETPTSVLLDIKNTTQIIPTSVDIQVWNTRGLAYGKRAFPADGGTMPAAGKDGLLGTVLIHATPADDELRIVVTGHAGSAAEIQGTQTVAVMEGSQIAATVELQQGLLSDVDGDGVPESIDNCPRAYNPDQANIDAAEQGNACATGLDAGSDGQLPPAGNALRFDGIDDFIPLPRIVKDSFTVELWMNTDCAGDSRIIDATIAGGTKGFSIGIAGGKAVYSVGNQTCTSYTTVTGGKWVHIAATRNVGEAQARLAINGGVEPSCAGGTVSLTDAADMIIGGGGSTPYCGQIDELRLWDVERTNQELTADKGRSLTGNEAHLVGYWRFDEEPSSTVLLSGVATVENRQIQSLVAASRRPTWVISTAPLQ